MSQEKIEKRELDLSKIYEFIIENKTYTVSANEVKKIIKFLEISTEIDKTMKEILIKMLT